ncbi:unnamed protein product [Bemisia tabaci]|uniref:Zinc finger CW-type PWWP domain protein 1 n=1 Tax=Bemisia tabaci TaxID=7038 RepID=A0A9P0A8G0_BEMTA|nr:unnamed protein product [Bemisia tabaci]
MSSNATKKPFKPPLVNKPTIKQAQPTGSAVPPRTTKGPNKVIAEPKSSAVPQGTTKGPNKVIAKPKSQNKPKPLLVSDFIDLETPSVKTTQSSASSSSLAESQPTETDSCPSSRNSSCSTTPTRESANSVPWGSHVTPRRKEALQDLKKKIASISGSPFGSMSAQTLSFSNPTSSRSTTPTRESANSAPWGVNVTPQRKGTLQEFKKLASISGSASGSNSAQSLSCANSTPEVVDLSASDEASFVPGSQSVSSNPICKTNPDLSVLNQGKNSRRSTGKSNSAPVTHNEVDEPESLPPIQLGNYKTSLSRCNSRSLEAKAPIAQSRPRNAFPLLNRSKSDASIPDDVSHFILKPDTLRVNILPSDQKCASMALLNGSADKGHSVFLKPAKPTVQKNTGPKQKNPSVKSKSPVKENQNPLRSQISKQKQGNLEKRDNILLNEVLLSVAQSFSKSNLAMEPEYVSEAEESKTPAERKVQKKQATAKKSSEKSNGVPKQLKTVTNSQKSKSSGKNRVQKRQVAASKSSEKSNVLPKAPGVVSQAPDSKSSRGRTIRKRQAENSSSAASPEPSGSVHGRKRSKVESALPRDDLISLAASKAGKYHKVPKVINGIKLSPEERLLALQKLRGDVGTWIQCCHAQCSKWRYVHDIKDPVQVPRLWYCRNNPDPEYNSCLKPEQKMTAEEEEDLIETKFTAGSVVWARVVGYPFWPAMVEDDPDYDQFYWCHDRDPQKVTQYHVTFFDTKAVTRSWVTTPSVKAFTELDNPTKRLTGKNACYASRINEAKKEASIALKLTNSERLAKCSFIKRFAGPIKKKKSAFSDKTGECSFNSSEDSDSAINSEDDIPTKFATESLKTLDPRPQNRNLKCKATSSGSSKSLPNNDTNRSKNTPSEDKIPSNSKQVNNAPPSDSETPNLDLSDKPCSASIFDSNNQFDNEVTSSQDILPDIPLKTDYIVLSPVMDDINQLTPDDIGALSQGVVNSDGGIFDSVASGFQRLSQSLFGSQDINFTS